VERSVEEALILGTVDYGDADRVVTLFTRERGRDRALPFRAGAQIAGSSQSTTTARHLGEQASARGREGAPEGLAPSAAGT